MKGRPESRAVPVAFVIALLAIMQYMPLRYRVLPAFLQLVLGAAFVIPMVAAALSPRNARVARIERWTVLGTAGVIVALEVTLLGQLLFAMSSGGHTQGLALLATAVGIWASNVVVFALIFWQLDRGGSWGRASDWSGTADFSFPRGDESEGVPRDWQPSFPDYLFLSFNTATAFSPTDATPLRARAKMLMLAESLVSLVTIVAVGARAINLLGVMLF